MTTLVRRPAPGLPGVFDVPVAVIRGGLVALTGDPVAASLDAMDRCLDELLASLDEGGPAGSRRQREDLAALERIGRRIDAARLRLVGRAEREGVAERAGHTDTGAWVAQTTDSDRRAAARDVHLASALGTSGPGTGDEKDEVPPGDATAPLDLTRCSLDHGDLSAAHARVVAQAMSELPDSLGPDQRRACEAELVRLAAGRSPGRLRLMARRVIEQAGAGTDAVDAHEDEVLRREEERAHERATFWIKDNQDGTMTGLFTVPWASGMVLKKVIDAMTAPRRRPSDEARQERARQEGARQDGAAAELLGGQTTDDDRLTQLDWQHRRGAALADLLLRIPTDHLSPKVAATLIVTTRLEDLRGSLARVGATDAADSVSAATARRLACGAGIIPAVLGGDSVPLDLGRQRRLFSEGQRVALSTRYTECAAEGCDRPFAWCEVHHLRPWDSGGPTDLDNAVPLCGRHHRMLDEPWRQHVVRRDPGGRRSVSFHHRT